MPMAAGPAATADRAPPLMPAMVPMQTPTVMSDAFAKDAILAWYRGEFAAANAIIDVLCTHLARLSELGSEYDAVFSAIHRRRMNWIPVLQMQKYHSIADVALELKQVATKKVEEKKSADQEMKKVEVFENEKEKTAEKGTESEGNSGEDGSGEVYNQEDDSPDSEITDSGSHEVQSSTEHIDVCSSHENCEGRAGQIKLTKGFTAKEQVKGHNVNAVKGLKLYEDIFTDSELSKLNDFVYELRAAGQKGELLGETFILFNKEVKGNKRELIQLGVPIFGHVKEEASSNNQTGYIEPIPAILRGVINHLIQWQLISEYKRPNGCIINFFDEGEYSQPFLKPPHLDQPITTLLLSNSTMAFGQRIVSDNDGNYRGPLMLSLKEGSLLVMRGNSADMARHVICSSSNRRVSLTFFRIRPDSNHDRSPPTTPMAGAMTLWQPGFTSPYAMSNGVSNGYEAMDAMGKWGIVRAPVVMMAPVRPVMLSPKRIPNGGTGVFLPWTEGSRKPTKHLPPRPQRGQLLALPSSVETHMAESTSEPGSSI
ncbi:hypothetical protein HS088_TW08G00782 [Tripterygium wilfordii]|uniref:Fe2OG dioxygenase domain-containing protein n=1 Tax=Tripterygium wilfordii TaxID=458696 RepID=A0A7J7DDN5_TRIWF|nr:RNA demethylase ALKBH10B-like [Tripterygium wilfordii]KAF5744186.1 hypothetical protein HS088_TW08G00782 [Tripterygium wilfordii]